MNRKKIYPTAFLILPLLIYAGFYILPGILGAAYSLTDWTIYSSEKHFSGLTNYANLLRDGRFKTGLTNTLLFALCTTAAKCAAGFLLALALSASIRTRNVLRTVFYLPMILSTLIVGVVFKSMLMPETGLINRFLGLFSETLQGTDWLGRPDTAMWMVILTEIWKGSGYCMVIFLAGLQAIPKDYYEAATIDGAGGFRRFCAITLPLMVPSININVLLAVVSGLKVFDIIIALTGGGPGMATEVLSTTVYSYMGSGALSAGSAANVVLTAFVIAVFFGINKGFDRIQKKIEE